MQKGFTLIESIFAAFVVTVGLVAVFSVLPKVTSITGENISKLTAMYLAQEGMELARNFRDSNWLSDPTGVSWKEGLSACAAPVGCEVDYTSASDDPELVSYGGRYLNKDSEGFFSYESGSPTKFKRRIIIDERTDPDDFEILDVNVYVEWQEKGVEKSVWTQEYLYNWK